MATSPAPLSALLSQVLVALTIEVDNAYEERAPHRTTRRGGTGPWLVSYAMWAGFLRLVPDEGIAAAELSAQTGDGRHGYSPRMGMVRWGYVRLAPPAGGPTRPGPAEMVVRPTRAGSAASAIWSTVPEAVEERWRQRFGAGLVGSLRTAAVGAASSAGRPLPGYLPVLGYRMLTPAPTSDPVPGPPSLITGLANALHAFAIECEEGWPVGLAAAANLLRVVPEDGTTERDARDASGIAKEATAFAANVLTKLGVLTTTADPERPGGRRLRVTPDGERLQAAYQDRAAAVEQAWTARPGSSVKALRHALEAVLAHEGGETVAQSLAAPPGTWRSGQRPGPLPQFPFVWHRGGYPDGS